MFNIFLKSLIILLIIFYLAINYTNLYKLYQLNVYNPFKIFSEINKKNFIYELFLLLIFNLLNFTHQNLFLLMLIYVLGYELISYFINRKNFKNAKNKLIFTKRFVRFYILFLTLNLIFLVLFAFKIIIDGNIYLIFINFKLISILLFLISHYLLLPIEEFIKKIYILKAKQKLKKMPQLKVIGITGSFGKTSVKNYLFEMLKTKYKVCKTPNSYNTPMGFTKVILNDLKLDDDFLILEYGADHNHDIKKLCKIIKPNYSIITGVTNQHLKTFKTLQNIISTKYELVENTLKGGCIVFNGDNIITKDFYKKTRKRKIIVGTNFKNDFYAKNIKIESNKTSFEFIDNLNNSYFVETKLLGRHNIINILLASSLSLKLGVSIEDIIETIKNLIPVPHRLNLIENNGKFILDDSFNANTMGVYCALEVLKTFKNNKIVITSGIVELGKNSYEENFKLGKALQEFNYVIITNKINQKALLDGLNGGKNKVFYRDNLAQATNLLKNIFNVGDCVLFLNDLPDSYN